MRRFVQPLVMAAAVLFCGISPFAQMADIPYDGTTNLLKGFPADTYLGEAAGVATNSQGHIFVFTRAGSVAVTLTTERTFVRGSGGARLFEFDQTGKYVREIGQGLYGFVFAHGLRIDPQDNIWTVDEGSNLIVKFNPQGQVVMTLGRKPEAITVAGGPAGGGGGGRGAGAPADAAPGRGGRAAGGAPPAAPAGEPGAAPPAGGGRGGRGGGGLPGAGVEGETFNRPTDVAWDAQGNIYLADGLGNSRIAKFDKSGMFVKSWGSTGAGQGQFSTVASIATDKQGNVYVADRGNHRIQVFDGNGTFKSAIANIGAPAAICITPGAHQYLYSSNSNDTGDFDQGGEIYKMELDGKVLGKFGKPGKLAKEFGTVSSIDCRNENDLLVGELTNWRVQKISLHPAR
jgi:DNA-binding beta-propeller fold protein YncE